MHTLVTITATTWWLLPVLVGVGLACGLPAVLLGRWLDRRR